jgi:membrane protein
VSRAQALLDRVRSTKVWRAWSRYGRVRGNVLAGGIAYFAFFSLFPAFAIGFTVFGLVLGRDTDLQARVVAYVNSAFGGVTVIGTRPNTGVVTIDQLVQTNLLTLWGAIGLLVLLATGLGWVGALRDGISAVFGQVDGPNPVLAKLRDLGALAGLGVGVLASSAVSVLVTAATSPVLNWLGMGETQLAVILVNVLTSLLLLVIDTLLFILVLRQMPGIRLPFDDLFTGALAGGVALGLLKVSGGVLLRSASSNRFLASFSIVVGLLIWLNLVARVALLAAAWAATTAADRGHLAPLPAPSSSDAPGQPGLPGQPGQPGLPGLPGLPEQPESARGGTRMPTYGPRAADRTVLAAGAVLGAAAAVGARALIRAGRTGLDLLRRQD